VDDECSLQKFQSFNCNFADGCLSALQNLVEHLMGLYLEVFLRLSSLNLVGVQSSLVMTQIVFFTS
jgi:hypothetical protein